MSLELARSKSSEDQLLHKMSKSFPSLSEDASNQALTVFNEARYQPIPISNSRKTINSWSSRSGVGPKDLTINAKTSSFASTSSKTSWTLDESNTSKLSNIGHFLRKNCSWVERQPNEGMHAQLPKQVCDNDKKGEFKEAFLEIRGVVFPVSSFEVINKGCLDRSINKSSMNEEWPEFY